MEWKRVKIILILLFFILNIFLAVNLVYSAAASGSDREMAANARAALQAGGVTFEADIPLYKGDMGYPEYTDTKYDAAWLDSYVKKKSAGSFVTVNEDNSVVIFGLPDDKIATITDEKALIAYIKGILKAMKFDTGSYELDNHTVFDDKRSSIKLVEHSRRNILSYDNTVELVITPAGIEYMKISHRKLNKMYDFAQILPAYQILLKNCNESGFKITKIDLGFVGYRLSADSVDKTYVAVWRVVDATGNAKYYRAYTGEEIIIY